MLKWLAIAIFWIVGLLALGSVLLLAILKLLGS